MLTGAELSASLDKLLALRKEIMQAFVDTFIMLGISTTVAIVIGGLFGVFLFLSSDRQFLQNKTLYGVLGAITNFMRAFPFVILMIAMSPFTKAQIGLEIFPKWVTVHSFHALPGASSAQFFDGNGITTKDIVPIESGVLQELFLSKASAERL